MVVTRPQVVIVMRGAEHLDSLRERAQDVRAEVAELSADMDDRQVQAALMNAKHRAEKRW
jgi:hypothetical protein